MIELTLPYPVSANRYWQSFVPRGATRAVVHLSTDAKAYIKQVSAIASAAGIAEPLTCRVLLELDLYPHRPQDWQKRVRADPLTWDDTVQCIDLGNAEKVLSDALQGIVFDDDKRIWDIRKRRMEPDGGEARVVVRITPLAKVLHPQQDLLAAATS